MLLPFLKKGQMFQKKQALFFSFSLAITGTILLGYHTSQKDFLHIFLGYGFIWIFYLHSLHFFSIAKEVNKKNVLKYFILGGIFLRILLLPSYPPLSDDYFRFIWDGYCQAGGISPFQYKPEEFPEKLLEPKYNIIYDELNSKIYYSVYPPLLQFIFKTGTLISPNHILGSIITMRIFLLLFEIGSIFLIYKITQHFSLPQWHTLIYALNPLVIVEITGNLHFEGMMIFFLMACIYFLSKIKEKKFEKSHTLSAVSLGLSAGAKLLPLMFLPVFIRKIGFKNSIIYGAITICVFSVSFFSLWDLNLFSNFRESIRLYYQSFEFNGGIYYVLRTIGYKARGYNEIAYIGPGMAILSTLFIFFISLKKQNDSLNRIPILFLFALTFYQLFSTTVHPWYIAPIIALASLTHFRFAILWSGLILLTYINYSNNPYYENLWIVGLEYIAVIGFILYEINKKASFTS